jgi:glycine/D-amino acid oxidase-like deaminating enzyme/nitrite reductase/ring-hydroxylating ferredoxin subunit
VTGVTERTTSAQASLWLGADAKPRHPVATGELRADVAVIGGGITGLTTAVLLARAGLNVVVCESEVVGAGVSGHNTAKVTALQGTVYSSIRRRHSKEVAAVYGAGSLAAVEQVADLAAGIDCDLERRPAYTFARAEGEVRAVAEEESAARAAGLPVRRTTDVDVPFPVHAAVRLDGQLVFHPVKYLRGLAEAVVAAGSVVLERSRVVKVEAGEPCRLHLVGAVVTADRVVVATHYPMLDRGVYFARLEPTRSYCIAARLGGPPPQGLSISAGDPSRSVSSHRDLLILGGEGHPVGSGSAEPERFERLEADARRYFDVREITHRWSAQDSTTYDELPVIGPYLPGSDRLYVAAGYMKWGLSTGTLAGMIISDAITGRPNPWAESLRPNRLSHKALPRLLAMNAGVGFTFAWDRLRPGQVSDPADVPPGEARVLRRGTRRTGVYRDATGGVHAVSLRCTHLGCLLRFNGAETSWDCPCHGSRFSVDGDVLEGPAVRPLDRHDPA